MNNRVVLSRLSTTTSTPVVARPNADARRGFHTVIRIGLWNAERVRASRLQARPATGLDSVADPHAC